MTDEHLINLMLANFQLATAELSLESHHQSPHWQTFNQDFLRNFADPELWTDFRNNHISHGLDDANPHDSLQVHEQVEKTLHQAILELRRLIAPEFIDLMEEQKTGHPATTFQIDGMTVSLTSFDNALFAWQIFQSLPDKNREAPLLFLEIGGGFGCLARMLKAVFPAARFILADLPAANAMSTYYLQKSFPDASIFTLLDLREGKIVDWQKTDFVILPGWCLASIEDSCIDYVINIRSMMEMRLETIGWYFDQIQRLIRPGGLFYCVNRYHKKIGSQDVVLADYPFDACWEFIYSQPKILQTHIHQLIARRLPHPNPSFPHPVLTSLRRTTHEQAAVAT